uniref:Peptidase M28 n=1 Tax=Solibacter usitatus (strain Ellin6076) TaxID=234267 RepID=Q028P3_SOLUE
MSWCAWAQPALEQPVIQHRLESLSRKIPIRRATLEVLFREAGCDGANLTAQRVPGSKEPNIICTLPGDSPSAIVVGGHYDLVEEGAGAVDDWSGAVLLPSLYETLKRTPRKHTYVFIAFAAEEVGLHGSGEYVKRLSAAEQRAIRAMINLECLGLATPKVWASRADRHLRDAYGRVAQSLGMVAESGNVDQVGDDDSHPFLNAKIPVLTIHSVTARNMGILHTARDQVSAIHPDEYYATYRLATAYLEYLDTWLE